MKILSVLVKFISHVIKILTVLLANFYSKLQLENNIIWCWCLYKSCRHGCYNLNGINLDLLGVV
jgi:hypothetical protein